MMYVDDLTKKERFIVALFFLIIAVAIHFLIDSFQTPSPKIENDEFRGVVIEKYQDMNIRKSRELILDNGHRVHAFNYYGLFDFVHKGDMIRKKGHEKFIIVIQDGKEFKFN